MNNFTFCSPTHFVFGKDTESTVGKYVKRYSGSKVLIHYGGGSIIRSGLLDRIKASLDSENIPYVMLGGVMPNPRSGLVYEGIDLCRREGVDFLLAVGGGSTIDSAKAIAMGVPYEGDFWDFYNGKPIKNALPVGTVLTIAAAGSEGSANTVITHEDGMLKRGTGSDVLRPKFSILNPALTQTLPAYQTACGITDILAHLYERYITDTTEVEVTDRLIEGLMLTLIHEAPRVIENPDNYDARANIMWTGTLAHNNVCGVGRRQDWLSHGFEHELSALYDCAHGAGLAVTMPAVFTYEMPHAIARFAQVAVRVWGCAMDEENPANTARAGIEALRQFLHAIGMPTTFSELGAKQEDIPHLVKTLLINKGQNGVVQGFLSLSPNACEDIYRLML